MRIVILGGTGLLGRALLPILESKGHDVVALSRSTTPSVDLASGSGLAETVTDAEVVVHLSSDARKPNEVDVAGTRRVIESMNASQHLVYMSIVGVDLHPFPYYRAKFEAESLIAQSGISNTILRATQFHDFIAYLLAKACRRWAALVPAGFVFQPIATREVAVELTRIATGQPAGLLADMAGPQVLEIETLARTYMTARAREAPVLRLPVPGKTGRAFRDGIQTNRERAVGQQTWETFLEELFKR